ncbi:MAG: hypothetical protein ACOCRK_03620 [bacterium]
MCYIQVSKNKLYLFDRKKLNTIHVNSISDIEKEIEKHPDINHLTLYGVNYIPNVKKLKEVHIISLNNKNPFIINQGLNKSIRYIRIPIKHRNLIGRLNNYSHRDGYILDISFIGLRNPGDYEMKPKDISNCKVITGTIPIIRHFIKAIYKQKICTYISSLSEYEFIINIKISY